MSDEQDERIIAYAGELITYKLKWSDANGYTSEFGMHEGDEGGHPLKRFGKGTRFYVVLVEKADDEQPVDQVTKQRIERHLKRTTMGGKLSREAGMLCRSREFQLYLYHQKQIDPGWDVKMREDAARHYICKTVGIKSRAELDHDEAKAAAYKNLVVDTYFRWRRENPAATRQKNTGAG